MNMDVYPVRVVALASLAALTASAESTSSPVAPGGGGFDLEGPPTELRGMDAPAAKDEDYSLGVVEVPPPPSWSPEPRALSSKCPLGLRAIVRGEGHRAFAVVAYDGTSRVIRRGEGIRTPRGWFAISSIGDEQIILQHDGEAYRCVLGGERGRH